MKKYLMTLGLMLGILSLTGCQKDNTDSSVNIESEKMITRTFTVAGEWCEDTRSYYEEGEGVKISGTEILSVYWGDAQYAANDNTSASKLNRIKGSPSKTTAFEYTFSHNPVEGASAYDYYFIMPNTTTNNQQSKGHRPMVYLNTIQTPAANSFDPAQDYLVGKPLLNQSEVNSNASVYFKRMFAPLRMTVKNGGLLQDGEKILYATISQSATCTAKTALVGSAYFRFSSGNDAADKSDAYADARVRNFLSTGYGNKVTAFYPTGLETDADGNYPVWYIVNPSNIDNDEPTTISGDMTITLVTDKRMVQRTVTLSNPMELAANALNKFSITFGDNATLISGEAVTTAFANVASLDELDTWSFSNCSYANSSLEIASGSEGKVTLPTVSGKKISKIIVLPSLYHPNNSSVNTLDLYAEETQVGSYNFNAQNMLTSAENMYGYLVIDVPTEYQTSELSLVKPSTDGAKSSIRAITLIYESSTAPAATVELLSADKTTLSFNVELANATKYYYLCQPAADAAPSAEEVVNNGTESTATDLTIEDLSEATEYVLYVVPVGENDAQGAVVSAEGKTKSSAIDYYELYTQTGSVTIGGQTFSATDWGDAILVTEDNLTKDHLANGGIVFVEYSETDLTASDIKLTNNLAIIGRYDNQQPIIITKKLRMAANCSFYFVNLTIKDGGSSNMFTTEEGTVEEPINTLVLLDCTFLPYNHLVSINKWSIRKTIIDNCIIMLNSGKGIYVVTNDNVTEQLRELAEELQVTNCVIYDEADNTTYLVGAGTKVRNLPNLTIKFSHNSLYNITRNPYINMYYAKSIEANYNAAYSTNATTAKSFMTVITADVEKNVGPYNVTNNYGNTINSDDGYYGFRTCNTKCVVTLTDESGNLFENTANPFISGSIDVENGYFPVNPEVVTNGAGATYETKLWYNWGE